MKSMYEAGLRLLSQLSPWSTTEMLPIRTQSRDAEHDINVLSPRLLSAVIGTDGQSDVTARDGHKVCWPEAYSAFGRHVRVGRHALFPDDEAPVARRFEVSEVSPALGRLFDNCGPGSRVMEIRLAGLEMCWHSDLLNASERQSAILGYFQLYLPDEGFVELEHLVVPDDSFEKTCMLHGWFNLLSGSLPEDVPWHHVTTGRLRRGQPIRIGPWGDPPPTSSGICASTR